MPLDALDKGEQRPLHIKLYPAALSTLDALAERYNCSRSAVLEELLKDVRVEDHVLKGRRK